MRRLHPAEEPADLAAVLPVARQYYEAAMPGFPRLGESRLRFFASEGYREYWRAYGCFADEEGEALGLLVLGFQQDTNTDLAQAMLMMPTASLHGEPGAAALREARRLAAAEGRSRLVVEGASTTEADKPLAAQGGRKVSTDLRSVLDLAGIDRAQYEAWAAPSPKNSEYRLVRWVDRCPDELAESFCAAGEAMHDAPKEDLEFQHPEPGIERLRGREEHSIRYGLRRHVQAVLDAEGRVAGFHVFVTADDEPDMVEIWDTGVSREHRGRGLGLRLKAAAALWMLEARESSRWVQTFNNHGNTYMLNVNGALGYRKAEAWYEFEFPTGAPAAA